MQDVGRTYSLRRSAVCKTHTKWEILTRQAAGSALSTVITC